ncbi:hypothetical protein [Actinopolymorpha pittospori]
MISWPAAHRHASTTTPSGLALVQELLDDAPINFVVFNAFRQIGGIAV